MHDLYCVHQPNHTPTVWHLSQLALAAAVLTTNVAVRATATAAVIADADCDAGLVPLQSGGKLGKAASAAPVTTITILLQFFCCMRVAFSRHLYALLMLAPL